MLERFYLFTKAVAALKLGQYIHRKMVPTIENRSEV
jgi:hypothetical protein